MVKCLIIGLVAVLAIQCAVLILSRSASFGVIQLVGGLVFLYIAIAILMLLALIFIDPHKLIVAAFAGLLIIFAWWNYHIAMSMSGAV